MRIGLRTKLFGVSVLLVSFAGLSSGAYLERALRRWMSESVEEALVHAARASREAVRTSTGAGPAQLDPLADRLGHAVDARVTIIRADGVVVGDSEVELEALPEVDDHSGRPEVLAASTVGLGVARRRSATLDTTMLYVAVPYAAHGTRGWVRVSTPLSSIDATVWQVRALIAGAGALGLAVAGLMSLVASWLFTRALSRLVAGARARARGDGRPLAVRSEDELGRLAGSFNKIADALEATVRTLADERDRFETVLAGMSDAVLAVDAEQRITLMNPSAHELLGLGAEALGRPLIDVLRPPELYALLAEARRREASAELELSPGVRVLARATSLRSGAGVVVAMHDVTEMRRLERVRRDFVANVSHELRTPVSVVQANAETLLAGALDEPEAARRFVAAIQRNAERLGRLVSDLLDLSRIEAGRYPLRIGPVSVIEAAERARDAVHERVTAKGHRLELEVSADPCVRADAAALDQVLVNLLDNAAKYTPDGGRLALSARRVGDRIQLEVIDDGPGIDPEHRPRVFERFYRVDPGRSRAMGGTGLGLAIVRHLVESMGGEVSVRGREPSGSVFTVDLPAAEPDEPEAAERTPGFGRARAVS